MDMTRTRSEPRMYILAVSSTVSAALVNIPGLVGLIYRHYHVGPLMDHAESHSVTTGTVMRSYIDLTNSKDS